MRYSHCCREIRGSQRHLLFTKLPTDPAILSPVSIKGVFVSCAAIFSVSAGANLKVTVLFWGGRRMSLSKGIIM